MEILGFNNVWCVCLALQEASEAFGYLLLWCILSTVKDIKHETLQLSLEMSEQSADYSSARCCQII